MPKPRPSHQLATFLRDERKLPMRHRGCPARTQAQVASEAVFGGADDGGGDKRGAGRAELGAMLDRTAVLINGCAVAIEVQQVATGGR
jgi:hypothetical protein